MSGIGLLGGQRDTRGQQERANREATCHSILLVMNQRSFCFVSGTPGLMLTAVQRVTYPIAHTQYMQSHIVNDILILLHSKLRLKVYLHICYTVLINGASSVALQELCQVNTL